MNSVKQGSATTKTGQSDVTMKIPEPVMATNPFTTGETKPFVIDRSGNGISVPDQITEEMENRRKNWLKTYKTKLDLNDVLEIRNP